MIDRGHRLLGALVFVASSFGSAAYAADIVILDSSTSALQVGDVVPAEQSVAIPSGAVVTLIMANGETRVVDGPYSGPLGDASGGEGGGIGALNADRGGETRVLGAVRAPQWEISE